jgi:biopolymer transport protein ExbD
MKKFDSINVIPFIDILLVLLTIVLITSTFINFSPMNIDLPHANTVAKMPKKSTTISIDKDGLIFLDKTPISKDNLFLMLQNINPNTHILINCDKNSKFNNFVTVLSTIKELKFNNISILTNQ